MYSFLLTDVCNLINFTNNNMFRQWELVEMCFKPLFNS